MTFYMGMHPGLGVNELRSFEVLYMFENWNNLP